MDVETQEIRLARQRASVKWLLSKAFNNIVPENIKEPFYRDHENQDRLKPQIVVELGNASLYCQALSNLYSDPNYQSLNHWSILQTLARKGVQVTETAETPLTETVLIQTNPLRINAHMTVIESLMILYAKEISSGDRILSAIRRVSGNSYQPQPTQNFEQLLLAWVAHVAAAMKRRISQEVETGLSDENGIRLQIPDIPPLRDFQDLCDGVSLGLLISYYCPKYLSWTSVRINYLPAVEDSIHNVLLVSNFSKTHLPYPVFHMTPEDVTYMRGPMKQNLVVLLADLFNLFEIHPAKCVCYPEKEATDVIASRNASSNEYGIFHRRGVKMQPITSIPDLRTEPDVPLSSPIIRPAFQGFVVYKSRGITTLSSMHPQQQYQQQESLVPALLRKAKEKTNIESKADERGDFVPAGRPSNWEQNRRPSYAGRRSRRNSSSEDSQLTIENFGGSQDQLNLIGRNQDRERERKLSNTSAEPAVAVRSSIVDARGTLQLGYDTDSGSEKQDRDTEKFTAVHQGSNENILLRASNSQLTMLDNNNIHPILNQHSIDKGYCDVNDQQIQPPNQSQDINSSKASVYSTENELTPKSKSIYFGNNTAGHPNIHQHYDQNYQYEDDTRSLLDASKLSTIRMKLEEKRRRIEQDKQKIEMAILRHQEKDDKESGSDSLKWETMSIDSKRISDIDPNDLEKYQQNITVMNSNLQDIQQDIQRLATQQSQIQAQHLQAQQLIQAQQIANVINQQSYGSQQHLAGHYQMRVMQQPSFGSTPHLPQTFNSHVNAYNSRPPSRNTQQYMQSQAIPYVNELGQCISQESQSTSLMMAPNLFNPQSQGMYNENCNQPAYSNISYTTGGHQVQSDTLYYHYPPQHPQQQYINRPKEYDDYRSPRRERDANSPQATPFYLHEAVAQSQQPQRRTWAQTSHEQQQFQQHQIQMHPMVDVNAWQSQNMFSKADSARSTWNKDQQKPQEEIILHRNGGVDENGHNESIQHLFPVLSSPQHNHQESPLRQHFLNNQKDNRLSNKMKSSNSTTAEASTDDIMAPQSICFIGDEEDVDEVERNIIESMQSACLSDYGNVILGQRFQRSYEQDENEVIGNKFNITSGNLTYRIPSPSRPSLNSNSFQNPHDKSSSTEKGFYISFDDEQPKRPKPPLRVKRSPKNGQSEDDIDHHVDHELFMRHEPFNQQYSMQNNSNKVSNLENNNATYNKYTDAPIQLKQLAENSSHYSLTNNTMSSDRRHLEDVTNQQQPISPTLCSSAARQHNNEPKSKALVIGTDVSNLDPESVDEMERRKEKIMLLSLQRRQQQEEAKARKEIEANKRREREREKEEERVRKKEEQMTRRAAILEQHRLKKAIEDAEREGKTLDRSDLMMKQQSQSASVPRLRHQKIIRPRPKTIHVETGSADISEASSISSRGKKGSNTNLAGYGQLSSNSMRRDFYRGSQDSLTVKESPDEYPSTSSTPIGRRGSYRTSREPTVERGRTLSRISVPKGNNFSLRGRKSNSLINLCDTDSGLGRATPPRRAPSPGIALSSRHMPSPSGPGSLPPGLVSKRRGFDDGSSDISSTPNSLMEYSGPKLYKQPAAKSNRGIILNAVEYCVFPGAVNRDAKQKVLEKIARSEAKHFLVLFRDAGCQFRALYSYAPESDQVVKLYGTGPSQVDEVMFDKFFKYNSGGKCFSQVHTKHLTVTIDAFTIHNSLWQGKKVHLPSKKDMTLVI